MYQTKFKKFFIKHNVIKDTFLIEPFVYVNEKTKSPCFENSSMIKWLEPFTINCFYKDKDALAFKILEDKYPEYYKYIFLF